MCGLESRIAQPLIAASIITLAICLLLKEDSLIDSVIHSRLAEIAIILPAADRKRNFRRLLLHS